MNELPVVKGLMVCEAVITDLNTRNTSVINRFTTLKLKEFPTPPRKVAVFAALSNATGRIPLRVRIDPLSGDESIYRFDAVIDFPARSKRSGSFSTSPISCSQNRGRTMSCCSAV